jgi:hypothetical protein
MAVDATQDRHDDAVFDFLTTVPVTMAGVLAALDHAASPIWPNEKGSNTDTVLSDTATAGDELVEAVEQFPAMIAATLRKLKGGQS